MKNDNIETKNDLVPDVTIESSKVAEEAKVEKKVEKKVAKKSTAKKPAAAKKAVAEKTTKPEKIKQEEPVAATSSDSILNSLYPSSTISTAEGTIGTTPVAGLPVELTPLTKEEVAEVIPTKVIADNPNSGVSVDAIDKKESTEDSKKEKPKKHSEKEEAVTASSKPSKEKKFKDRIIDVKLDIDSNIDEVNKRNLERGSKTSAFRIFCKIFVCVISGLICVASTYLFLQVFDFTNPAEMDRLFLVAPLAGQVVVGIIFITLISTSRKRVRIIQYVDASDITKAREERDAKKAAELEFFQRVQLLRPEIEPTTPTNAANFSIESYYGKPVEEINGKLYMSVSPYADSIKALESLGATDLDLLKVNMAGSDLFNEILNQSRTPTLNSKDITVYFMSKPGAYTIKKRGALNWTFKYSFKSFGIIRESKDGYNVSIKCYPDAAIKLNEKYMALEDSTFPSGPLWFCFTELRNLPPRVCKWLIDTSFQISRFQQIKTDKLREFKTPADLEIDLRDIAERYNNGQSVMVYPKYALIFSTGGEADLSTYLTRNVEGMNTDEYTKEYYYKFKNKDVAVSMLTGKAASEEMIATFMEHVEEIFM